MTDIDDELTLTPDGGSRRNLGVLLRVACRVSRHPCRGLTTAGDRVVELRVDGLNVVGLITCEREGIVGGDEGPVGGVAQVVCHGVTVGHEEREEEVEERQEVESDEEKTLKERCACPWMG